MADLYLVDATVIVDELRGVPDAVNVIEPLLRKRAVLLHPAVHAEILAGARDRRHLAALDAAVARLRRCAIKGADMDSAIELLRTYTLAHGIGWPDCFIAATCLRLKVPLVTLNDKHFKPIRGLSVIRPY